MIRARAATCFLLACWILVVVSRTLCVRISSVFRSSLLCNFLLSRVVLVISMALLGALVPLGLDRRTGFLTVSAFVMSLQMICLVISCVFRN